MVIGHNVPALFTHLSMRRSDRGLQQAMTRLSSGMKINSAKEDAAGLAIANKLNYQVGGLMRASENSTHGISLIQTAEGALNEVHNMLQRMRELSVQAAHGTLVDNQRAMIQEEIEQLTAEIHSISRNTEYNRMRILNGEANRVVDNSIWNVTGTRDLTRNIVTTLFVSHQVPPGNMNYTIEQAGRPAMVELIPDTSIMVAHPVTGSQVFPENTGFTVNGNAFDMSNKTWEEVQFDINERLPYMGMTMYEASATIPDPVLGPPNTIPGPNAGSFFLVTNLAGRDQDITLTGQLSVVGITLAPGESSYKDVGEDAIVNTNNFTIGTETIIGGLIDINGNPVAGASLAASATGNYVLIRGSRGEDIRINIQVEFDPDAVANNPREFFRFPGVPGSVDGGFPISDIGGMSYPNGLHMYKDFRDFGPIMLQIGPSHNTAMPVQIPRLNAETLGLVQYVGGTLYNIIDVRPTKIIEERGAVVQVGAEAALALCDAAIQTVSDTRARLGAYQNRLESTVRNLDVAAENTEISRSRIQDTDMARETTRYAQYNVMFQSAMALLGQANQRPQQIISLLQ